MSDKFIGGFSASPGVLGRIAKANTRSTEHTQILSGGDLHLMGVWERFLRSNGFDVGRRNVYPAFRTAEEKKKAIQLLWEKRVEGWWCLRRYVIRMGIATEEEVRKAFDELP